ncbi:uncharacterized protein LOC126377985 [Pectinophora gossypiella]|uniref:uncharacterized protein LOC126377985 n=1 Tax=Pectinophora gossypiella TaxID=13191 RepID=UPI00214E0263|nr:uncharacterized protein LOC126377985 [Pectinophora gossypiella]
MLATLLVVCATAASAHNITTGTLVEGQQAPAKQPATQEPNAMQSPVVPPQALSEAHAPAVRVSQTSVTPVEASNKVHELMFGLSPAAVPGGLEVALVTVNTPLLPPELAALMPKIYHDEDYQFQLIDPFPRRNHRPPRPHRDGARRPAPPPPSAQHNTTAHNNIAINKDKLERLMNFIRKNRDLLKLLTQTKQKLLGAPRGGGETGAAAGVLRPGASKQYRRSEDPSLPEDDDTAPQLRAHNIYDANQLDMAPATDMKIHEMRLNKGRLCLRHILQPEGPKYNKAGRIYWKEFVSTEEMHFELTRAPRLLLPACCNCCAKSALGCE